MICVFYGVLNSLSLDHTCLTRQASEYRGIRTLTLDFSNSFGEDVSLGLGVADALHNVPNNGLGEVCLLALPDALLIANPRVENILELCSQSDFLLLLKRLRLERRCLFGERKECGGDGTNVLHLTDGIDTAGHRRSVFGACSSKYTFDLVNLGLCPVGVWCADCL